MRRWVPLALALVLLAWGLVRLRTVSRAGRGPVSLVVQPDADGRAPLAATLDPGLDPRPALLSTTRFRLALPRKALLTFGLGVAPADLAATTPGWFHARVRQDGRTVFEHRLNPRALHGWRDITVELAGGSRSLLELEVSLEDREGRPAAAPPGLLMGFGDPTVHDQDAYGRAPVVVLVSIDTLRRDHVGLYGYPRPTTPRLDALAHEAVAFEDAVSTASWTLPAHLSMMTGLDPHRHGGVDMTHGFNRQVPTLAEVLREGGFATRAVTSHLYVSHTYGLDAGFDHMDFRQDRKATETAERAIDLVDRFGDRPLFLFLHFYDPHWHYDPPEAQRRLFEHPYTGTVTGNWQDFSRRPRESLTPADLQHLLDLYDGEIRYTDDELGRVLDHLKARGIYDQALLVVTSDHGEEFLDHGSWEHQKTLYEEVVRIPLVIKAPGLAARREKAPVSLLDLAPTVLAWAHRPESPLQQGRSLLAPAGDREQYGETQQTADGTDKFFLRAGAGRWKAILSIPRDQRAQIEEWYDLASDPGERRNAPPPDSIAAGIRARALARWQAERGRVNAPAVCLDAEQRERLRTLGYVGGGPDTCADGGAGPARREEVKP